MKRSKMVLLVSILCILAVGALFTGCGDKNEKYQHYSKNGIETWDSGYMRENLTALELTELMGNGTNLGNTMEAYGHTTLGIYAAVSEYETYWGQPVTTQEMLDGMKAAGFDSIRIPIAWTNVMNYEGGDYTIREDYLNRVEEIINYALNNHMYVIINDHWDGSWWGMFGSATEATREKAMDLYVSMWTQIAERYKEYSDYLIFESANEELGSRLNDIDVAADSGALSEDECYEMTNKINQVFVDTIRATGGNNEQRFLLIAGYNTDIEKTCDDRYQMPTDTAKNKLLVSIHYYNPWGYCGNTSLSKWGSVKHYTEQNELLEMMTKFTAQGYGVVIGEYRVSVAADGGTKEGTYEFYDNFLNNCDIYGFAPMLWDCSDSFVRRQLKITDETVAKVFSEHSLTAQSSTSKEDLIAAATSEMAAALVAAESFDAGIDLTQMPDTAIAWIMFNSKDWNCMYSVGDTYDPTSITDGLVATDVTVTGAGTYTVGLDFTGTAAGYANSTAFSALAIGNGELLYPGYIVTIKEILVNGEPYAMVANPYTCTDDMICTRVNLYNGWVTKVPAEARTLTGDLTGVSAAIVDPDTLGNVKTLTITFEYGPAEQ